MKPLPIIRTAVVGLLGGLATAGAAGAAAAVGSTPAEAASSAPAKIAATVEQTCPGLASGALATAAAGSLPAGVLLQADGGIAITAADLQAEMDRAPESMRASLRRNALFLLEQLAAQRLLLAEARQAAGGPARNDETALIPEYLQTLTASVTVSEAETAAFYEANQEMCGGAKFGDIKDSIKDYALDEKRRKVLQGHILGLGGRHHAVVAADWLNVQNTAMRQNPVDRARASGMPSIVDFGAKGCRPCDMLAPVLDALQTQYAGKMNVLFISVREEPVLAARYGISTIPVQVFFDKNGKELFRHNGFWPQAKLEAKAAELGVKPPAREAK